MAFKAINYRKSIHYYKQKGSDMKKLIPAALILILIAGCSGPKEIVKSPANVGACSGETKINPGEFYGETVNKLDVYQAGKTVNISFEVKTTCNSKLDYDLQVAGQEVKIKLKNLETQSSDCVCYKSFSLNLDDALKEGTYTFSVTNAAGYQLLSQKTGVVITE